MNEVKPFITCVDYWPVKLTAFQMAAYRVMIDSGQIMKHHVIFNERTGSTTIEYFSTVPHEWIRQELKRLVEDMESGGNNEQMETKAPAVLSPG